MAKPYLLNVVVGSKRDNKIGIKKKKNQMVRGSIIVVDLEDGVNNVIDCCTREGAGQYMFAAL